MHFTKWFVRFCFCLSMPLPCMAVTTAFYASLAYDEGNYTVTGYAGTLGDYSTAWYYDTWACSQLLKNGNIVDEECVYSSNASSEAWTHDYDAQGENTYDLENVHPVTAVYEYWEVVSECDPWCSGYWSDYYGYSLISTSGPLEENYNYYAPEQNVAVQETVTLIDDSHRRISTACVLPNGEASVLNGFGDDFPIQTAGYWRQTLGPGSHFNGRQISEVDGGLYEGDSCYFQGSAFARVTEIPELGEWTVAAGGIGDNKWGYDAVGWLSNAVVYYQNAGRADCGVGFYQHMYISCGSNPTHYHTSVMRMWIRKNPNRSYSERNGAWASRLWP